MEKISIDTSFLVKTNFLGKPIEGVECNLHIAGKQLVKGVTDIDGKLLFTREYEDGLYVINSILTTVNDIIFSFIKKFEKTYIFIRV